jgi:hypothetical protein
MIVISLITYKIKSPIKIIIYLLYKYMSLVFINKNKHNIHLVNTLLINNNKYNIYKYSVLKCDKYFTVNNKYKHIWYTINKKLYIVNLDNTGFTNNFKKKINFINSELINILSKDKKKLSIEQRTLITNITKKLSEMNIFRFYINNYNCFTISNLDNCNEIIKSLNNKLNCNNYTLKIEYILNMEENTELVAESYMPTNIILCIYNKKKCVSSIVFNYESDILYFVDKTNIKFQNKNIDNLLKTIVIILSKYIYPKAKKLINIDSNADSIFFMLKQLNAKTNVKNKLNNLDDIKNYLNMNVFIEYIVSIDDKNIKNANNVFNKLIKTDFDCKRKYSKLSRINTKKTQTKKRKQKNANKKTKTKKRRKKN